MQIPPGDLSMMACNANRDELPNKICVEASTSEYFQPKEEKRRLLRMKTKRKKHLKTKKHDGARKLKKAQQPARN